MEQEIKAVEAFRLGEARYRSLYEAVEAGIVVLDAEGRCVEVNQTALDIVGIVPQQPVDFSNFCLPNSLIHEDGTTFRIDECPGMFTIRTGNAQRRLPNQRVMVFLSLILTASLPNGIMLLKC